MVIRHLILGTVYLLFSATITYAQNEVYFTPSLQCENKLVSLIDNAEESIDAAVYAITNQEITEALKRARQRGIKIRILTDKLQASNRYSKVMEIYNNGINIKVNSRHKIEHNKFAVFDNKIISTGSYNWTESASKKNSENCLFLSEEPKITNEYIKAFNHLWQINLPEKSIRWFTQKNKRMNYSRS